LIKNKGKRVKKTENKLGTQINANLSFKKKALPKKFVFLLAQVFFF